MGGVANFAVKGMALFGQGERLFLIPDHLGLNGQQVFHQIGVRLLVHHPCPFKQCARDCIEGSRPFSGNELTLSLQGKGDFGSAEAGLHGLRNRATEVVM
ncbi:hypothetical protein AA19596_2077 [Acetobacter fabarum DSM 19596]|nr:hypothetical protein AA19596_2077 [Acetobacter fabarum DSM 19596]